jgi:nickel-dependent lactate racemase
MQKIEIPWGKWYGDSPFTLTFPDDWKVERADMKDAPEISDEDIREAFENPIGSSTIAELASGKKTATIAVDDLTRPTEGHRLLPILLDQLKKGGIKDDDIKIVMALGSHRPLFRQDLIKKFGQDLVDNYRIYNHSPFENLVDVGKSKAGTPIQTNRWFMEADLKIAMGSIVPHPTAGWGGGGKIVVPGVCSLDTLEAFHGPRLNDPTCRVAEIEGNSLRADIDDIARVVGLDIIVNAVGTSRGGTAGVFVGDIIKAHRAGVALAEEVYATEVPQDIDVGIFNAYPEDSEFIQCGKALNVWVDPEKDLVKKGGTILVTTAASEGRGTHFLSDTGMRLDRLTILRPAMSKQIAGRRYGIFSPNTTKFDVLDRWGDGTFLFNDWPSMQKALSEWHGSGTHAVVFPYCSLQYLKQ